MRRRMNNWPVWPNARDWIGIGTFIMAVMILWMMKEDKSLREDEFFKVIATLIIGTGFINGIVGWAYGSTKTSGDIAESNARIVESVSPTNEPIEAVVTNTKPIPVKETKK